MSDEKIAELEKKLNLTDEVNISQQQRFQEIDEKISELKEEIQKINVLYFDKTAKYGYQHFYNDFYKTKKVLRELGRKIYDHLGAKHFGYWSEFEEKLEGETSSVDRNRRVGKVEIGCQPSAEPTRAVEKQRSTDSKPEEPTDKEDADDKD